MEMDQAQAQMQGGMGDMQLQGQQAGKVCIEIEVSPDGQVMFGICPPEEESNEPKGYMQPVGSIDEALAKAKEVLAGQGEADQNDMWNRVQRDRQMSSQPGGPMMGKQ